MGSWPFASPPLHAISSTLPKKVRGGRMLRLGRCVPRDTHALRALNRACRVLRAACVWWCASRAELCSSGEVRHGTPCG